MAPNRSRNGKARLENLSTDQRYRLLVENLNDSALYLIDPEGRVASWNSGAERIFGYSAKEALGRPFESSFSADDRATGTPENILRLAANDERTTWEGWRICKDGSQLWTAASINAVRDGNGQLLG